MVSYQVVANPSIMMGLFTYLVLTTNVIKSQTPQANQLM